jgi:hypothetical protein
MDLAAIPLPEENLGQVYDKALGGLGSWMPIEFVKQCKKCGEVKALGAFYTCKGNQDGRHGACKECWHKRNGEYKQKQRLERSLVPKEPAVVAAEEEKEKNRAAGLRKCKECEEVKGGEEFYSCKGALDGKQGTCIGCHNKHRREDYQKPEAKAKSKEFRERSEVKAYREEYMGRYRQTPEAKVRRKECREKPEIKAQEKEYSQRPEVRARANERSKKKRAIDLNFGIAQNLRHRMWGVLKGKVKVGSAVDDLGCSIDKFKAYLESHFNFGMTWENYGNGFGKWNLDHIIPLTAFDLTNREQYLFAAHYTNYQPMWALENISKGNRY